MQPSADILPGNDMLHVSAYQKSSHMHVLEMPFAKAVADVKQNVPGSIHLSTAYMSQ